MLKSIGRSRFVVGAAGGLISGYLNLVHKTSRIVVDPPDAYRRLDAVWPFILATWHGQHFMTPFFRRPTDDLRVLVSRHQDGEINATALRNLGLGLVRGSGDHKRRFVKKGGAVALRQMVRALGEGATVALTADVPKGPARKAGLGIVTLARMSGRPIVPVAVATSRSITLSTWDKASINLPFSRLVFAIDEPIWVPRDSDEENLERCRQAVDTGLDRVTARAYALVEGQADG